MCFSLSISMMNCICRESRSNMSSLALEHPILPQHASNLRFDLLLADNCVISSAQTGLTGTKRDGITQVGMLYWHGCWVYSWIYADRKTFPAKDLLKMRLRKRGFT